jgi:hypothetical protein
MRVNRRAIIIITINMTIIIPVKITLFAINEELPLAIEYKNVVYTYHNIFYKVLESETDNVIFTKSKRLAKMFSTR